MNRLMRVIILIFICFQMSKVYCQNFKSAIYKYQIEIPKNYNLKEATGKNIDFKAVNKLGSSVIIVVKQLPKESQNYSAKEMSETPKEELEKLLSEYLPNPKFIKSGLSKLGKEEAFWFHYTSNQANEPKMYHINYSSNVKGYIYTLTCTCLLNQLDNNMPTFIRAIKSFKF